MPPETEFGPAIPPTIWDVWLAATYGSFIGMVYVAHPGSSNNNMSFLTGSCWEGRIRSKDSAAAGKGLD